MLAEFWTFNGARFDYLFFAPQIMKAFPSAEIKGTATLLKIFRTKNFMFKDIALILSLGCSLAKSAEVWNLTERK